MFLFEQLSAVRDVTLTARFKWKVVCRARAGLAPNDEFRVPPGPRSWRYIKTMLLWCQGYVPGTTIGTIF